MKNVYRRIGNGNAFCWEVKYVDILLLSNMLNGLFHLIISPVEDTCF